jgi:hypothetical protein
MDSPKFSLANDTIEWLIELVASLKQSDEKNSIKLDEFIKNVDNIIDRTNELELYGSMMRDTNTAYVEYIYAIYDCTNITHDDTNNADKKLVKLNEVLKISNNMHDALYGEIL